MKERDLYSIDEARERLGGISRNLIYEILRSGRLSSVRLGCRRLIPAAAIAQLIAQSATTISPTEAAARSYIPAKQTIDISQRRSSQGR
jgi:excisionase family DNA binding protein